MSVGVVDDEVGESTYSGMRSVWASPRICNGQRVTNAISDDTQATSVNRIPSDGFLNR
jgi:hypothetical protein